MSDNGVVEFRTLKESNNSPRLETKKVHEIIDILAKKIFEQSLFKQNISLNQIFLKSLASQYSGGEIANAVSGLVSILKKPKTHIINRWQEQKILPYPSGDYGNPDIDANTKDEAWQTNGRALLNLIENGIKLEASERILRIVDGKIMTATREITDGKDLINTVKNSFADPEYHQVNLSFSQPMAISEIADISNIQKIKEELKSYFYQEIVAGRTLNIKKFIHRFEEYPGSVIKKGVLEFIHTLGPNIEVTGKQFGVKNSIINNKLISEKTENEVTLTELTDIQSFISQKFATLPQGFSRNDLENLGDIFVRSTYGETEQRRLDKISEIELKMSNFVSILSPGRDLDIKFLISSYPGFEKETKTAIAKVAGDIMRNNPNINITGRIGNKEYSFTSLPDLNKFLTEEVFGKNNLATLLFRKKTPPTPIPQSIPTTETGIVEDPIPVEQREGQKQLQIYEFSTGIYLDYDNSGNFFSRGFTGEFINNSFPNSQIPEAVSVAINNELFKGAEDSTISAGSLISREVSFNGKSYSVVAVLTRSQDEYKRGLTVTRYFVAEGLGHLPELAKSSKVFDPGDKQTAGVPRVETFDDVPEQLTNPELMKYLDEDTPIVIPYNVDCQPSDLALLAKLKNPGLPISFAFGVNSLEKYTGLTIIKPSNQKAESIIRGGILSEQNKLTTNIGSNELVDLKIYQYAVGTLKETPPNFNSSASFKQKYTQRAETFFEIFEDPTKQNYFHNALVANGLKPKVYNDLNSGPLVVRVAVLSLLSNPSFDRQALLKLIKGDQTKNNQGFSLFSAFNQKSTSNSNIEIANNLLSTLESITTNLKVKSSINSLRSELGQ